MTQTDRYIHGTHREEQDRLSRLNRLLNQACMKEIRLSGGERVLDLGCGIAQLTRDMARAAGPAGRVVGVERSPDQVAEATRQAEADGEAGLVDLRTGDVIDPPLEPGEWGTFDVVHARFILEHVRDPLRVVRNMVRAARPGGRIFVADDDHEALRLWPEPPGLDHAWRAYIRTYDRNGNDPFVGRRLVELLHQGGARPVRNTVVFFGACAGEPTFPAFVDNLIGVIDGAAGEMVATGQIDAPAIADVVQAIREWGQRPDSAFWYFMPFAEGVKPLE